jgi:hypothetical protein
VTGWDLADGAGLLVKEFYVSLHLHVVVICEADSVLCSVVKNGAEAVRKFRCQYLH